MIELTDRWSSGVKVKMLLNPNTIVSVKPDGSSSAIQLIGGGAPISVAESYDEVKHRLEVAGHAVVQNHCSARAR